jgi:glycosyltransferase involved in cell wall biosynthesis
VTAPRPSVAIVHDYLTQRGGAERVVLAMHRAFPDAPLYTSLYDPDGTYPEFAALDVRPSPLDRVGFLRRSHRMALPLLAPTFSAMRVDADAVICSSSGWAHGVRTDGRKLVYCHAPARWLYQADEYSRASGTAVRAALGGLRPALTRWDQHAARSADTYLANSRHTREQVQAAYGIDALVVHPPHGMSVGATRRAVPSIEPGFYLCVSRLLAYKHVDAVVEAFRRLPEERLVVVGRGPDEARVRAAAGGNVRFLSELDDDAMRWLYANARALIAASYEDFGLTPLEAAAFGRPTIALRYGGYLDTVIEGTTGLFFDTLVPRAIALAVRRLREQPVDSDVVSRHARGFGEDRFRSQLHELVGCDRQAATAT